MILIDEEEDKKRKVGTKIAQNVFCKYQTLRAKQDNVLNEMAFFTIRKT
jgi:hypothetical protein